MTELATMFPPPAATVTIFHPPEQTALGAALSAIAKADALGHGVAWVLRGIMVVAMPGDSAGASVMDWDDQFRAGRMAR